MKRKLLKILLAICMSTCTAGMASMTSLATEETDTQPVKGEVISDEPAKRDIPYQDGQNEQSAPVPYELEEVADREIMQEGTELSGTCGDNGSNITWSLDSGVLKLEGSGKMADYPSGGPWISYAKEIEEIRLDERITYLGTAAFFNCNMVTEVTFPQALKSTGQAVFGNCSSLKSVMLNEGLEKLPEYVFQNTAIESVILPGSLSSMSPLVFMNCSNLQSIEAAEGSQKYMSEGEVLFSKDGRELVLYPQGNVQSSFTVPDGVQVIGEYAFSDAGNLRSITLSDSVSNLKDGALIRSGIESLELPDSVTSVGSWICDSCLYLKSVSFGNGLKTLGYQAFQSCKSLVSLNFGSSFTDLGLMAFARCSALTEVTIPEGVENIKNGTFGECRALQQVSLPETLKEIWYQAFFNCASLETISLPGGITSINEQSFWGTALSEITIPESVLFIGEDAFPIKTVLNFENPSLAKQEDGSYQIAVSVMISADYGYKEAFRVLDLVNQERRKQGLSEIKMDQGLLKAAMLRAAETSIYYSHTRPTGQDCFSASSKMYAENIAAGQYTPEAAMNSWMNSSGHRANIMNGSYKSIGIGAVKVSGCFYWVQCFGSGEAEEVSSSVYQNKTERAVVSISENMKGYYPDLRMDSTSIKAGKSQKVSFAFNNGFYWTTVDPVCIIFESSDEKVCSVSEKGEVKGLGAGKSEIKASLKGHPQISVSKTITVKSSGGIGTGTGTGTGTGQDTVKVTKLTISGNSRKIAAGKKIKLTVAVLPANASNKAIVWKSSNPKVAAVNASGVVTMNKKSGGKSVTITAVATDGSQVYASYKLTSMKDTIKKIAISGKKSVKAGKSVKLKAKVTAGKKANKKLKWTSSSKKYASVSSSGKVKTYKAGKGKKVKITAVATDGSGKKKSITIKIK